MADQNILVQEQPIASYELIEIPVTTSGLNRVPIPDIPQLRNQPGQKIIVKAIECFSAKAIAKAPVSGTVTAPLAELQKASLVLYCDGWEKEHYIPLLRLNPVHDSDATTATTVPFANNPAKFDNLKNVDWNKSYINFQGVTASAPYSILLGVHYLRFNSNNQQF